MFECVHSTISFTYAQKWIVIEMAPVIVAGFLLLGVFVSNVAESLRKRVRLCVVIAKTGDMLVGGIFTVSAHGLAAHGLPSSYSCQFAYLQLLYYTYFSVLKKALEIFACTKNLDGVYSLDADPSYTCWTDGGTQLKLVPFAILSIICYGLGVPCAIAVVMQKYQKRIRRDQSMPAACVLPMGACFCACLRSS
jgi:hypothetical protein